LAEAQHSLFIGSWDFYHGSMAAVQEAKLGVREALGQQLGMSNGPGLIV